MLQLDKNFLAYIQKNNFKRIKFFFYEAGCSGMKVDVIFDNFDEKDAELIRRLGEKKIKIYVSRWEKESFRNATISRVVTSDHTGEKKVRYIFMHTKVKQRCGCGNSFNFKEKELKLNLFTLEEIKKKFAQ